MATILAERLETPAEPGYRGFIAFCESLGFDLEPYMRRIARAYFSRAREVVAVLARGNWKTSLAGGLALHHLLTTKGASVVIGARADESDTAESRSINACPDQDSNLGPTP